jgi:hypothetical protein
MCTEYEHNPVAEWLKRALDQEREMNFRLRYDGLLPTANSKNPRCKEKNQIRWALNRQLITLFTEADFSRLAKRLEEQGESIDFPKRRFKGFGFLAIVSSGHAVACKLSIHIERRDMVGGILNPEGDLDNRMKTLLDALRLPQNENEVMPPDDSTQKNCFCLLEDDSLITGLNIQTSTSLEELPKGHVRLSIDVEVKAHDLMYEEET